VESANPHFVHSIDIVKSGVLCGRRQYWTNLVIVCACLCVFIVLIKIYVYVLSMKDWVLRQIDATPSILPVNIHLYLW
jgi:hypothetical protein